MKIRFICYKNSTTKSFGPLFLFSTFLKNIILWYTKIWFSTLPCFQKYIYKCDKKLTSLHLSPRPCTFQADIDKLLIIVHMYKFNNKNMIYWCKIVCSIIYRFVQRKITLFFSSIVNIYRFSSFWISLIKRKTIGKHFQHMDFDLFCINWSYTCILKVSLIKQIIRNKQKNINKCFLSSR